MQSPTYRSLGDHTEAIEVVFRPSLVSYEELLRIFFDTHAYHIAMPRQYRSAIWYHSEAQRATAVAVMEEVAAKARQVVTALKPAGTFYRAEDYHQHWNLRHKPNLFAAVKDLAEQDETAFEDSTLAARLNGIASGNGSPELLDDPALASLSDEHKQIVKDLVSGKQAPHYGACGRK